MTTRTNALTIVVALTVWSACGDPGPASTGPDASPPPPPVELGPGVDLRVLIIAAGSIDEDPGRQLMEPLLDQLGVPYDVLDSLRQPLTEAMLHDGDHGFYNGIILTEAQTHNFPADVLGLTADEFAILHEYERAFGVRESVIAGFPATRPDLGLDYGMDMAESSASSIGRWTAPAGGTEHFEYVNVDGALPVDTFAFKAIPRAAPTGLTVTPMLVDDATPEYALISLIQYDDGREILLSTVNNAPYYLHSQVLAYEFLNFATRGLFVGSRHVYLSVHSDDLFLADEVWDPATNQNWPKDVLTYRMSVHDVANVVAYEADLRTRRPLFSDIGAEFAFNGLGAMLDLDFTVPQNLTQAIYHHRGALRFINHTFRALQMDRLCPESAPQPESCPVTDYMTAYDEIDDNRDIWQALDLPGYEANIPVLLSDSHSGLSDRNGTYDDYSDDIDFPEGANPNFLEAASVLGIRGIASDASRLNQDRIQRIPGFDLVMLPRFPTHVYYNATTPEENTDEFNYLNHERYIEQGLDPCMLPYAVCQPLSYEDLLAYESRVTVLRMLSYRPFPHYFHQSNLRDYDGNGSTLQFDWIEASAELYEQLMKLPVRSPRFHEYHDIARQWLSHREAGVQGFLSFTTDEVVVWSARPGTVRITGVPGGEVYGGQHLRVLEVSSEPARYPVDRGLER